MAEDRLYVGPLYVKKSPVHGYGVFAAQDLAENEVIEECHTLFYRDEDNPLFDYSFESEGASALPLGFGCIYNHSSTPNVSYSHDRGRRLIIFKTLAPIRQDEELFSSYGKHWFSSRDLKMHSERLWPRFYRRGGRLLLRATLVALGIYACIHGLPYLSV